MTIPSSDFEAATSQGEQRANWCLIASLLVWTFCASCSPLMDFDIWWHLKTGQLILERGTVPFGDWFTFTENDASWVDLHWGFQLLAVGLFALGGVAALTVATAAAITGTVVLGFSSSGRALPVWIRVGVWSFAAVSLSGRALARPELITLLGLSMWLWIIDRLPSKPRWIWWLPILQIVWSNCHALSVLGLVVAGAFAVDQLVVRLSGSSRDGEMLTLGTLLKVGALLLLSAFVNPYLEEGVFFPLVLFRKLSVDQAFYATRIDEFMPPAVFFQQAGLRSWHFDAVLLLWLSAALSFFARVFVGAQRSAGESSLTHRLQRLDVMRLLLFLGFSYLGWKMMRNTSLVVIIAANALCANLAVWRIGTSASERRNMRFTWSLCGLVVFLTASHFTGHWGQWSGSRDRFSLSEPASWFAHDAVKFVNQPGMPNRAFVANIGQAGVFIFHNAPQRLVFMDGRLEVCSRRTFEAFESALVRMAQGDPSFVQLIGSRDEHGALPVVILDSRSSRPSINGMFRIPSWRLVFADGAAAVFIETELANKLQLPAANPEPLLNPPD